MTYKMYPVSLTIDNVEHLATIKAFNKDHAKILFHGQIDGMIRVMDPIIGNCHAVTKDKLRFALVTVKMFCKQQYPECQECPISITCARRCFQDVKLIAGEAIAEMDKEERK